ncbi:MAG TPA: hypothetical protein VKE41_23070 [Roseiflexaceae bacterium]|nr:hypothetical protein [Roseiflexaceae bacterium]
MAKVSLSSADYTYQRAEVAAGHIREIEPNTFVDERPDTDDPDACLPHHYCDEADVPDLLRRFTLERIWVSAHPTAAPLEQGLRGKWVAWARKPM